MTTLVRYLSGFLEGVRRALQPKAAPTLRVEYEGELPRLVLIVDSVKVILEADDFNRPADLLVHDVAALVRKAKKTKQLLALNPKEP